MENILKFSHMLGLSIWLGSMVMWALFAPNLYKIDPTKITTNTLRKTFSTLSWSSYSLSLLSGVGIFLIIDNDMSTWGTELLVLIFAGIVIGLHIFASKLSSALRGMLNGVMLLSALVVVYLATININKIELVLILSQ